MVRRRWVVSGLLAASLLVSCQRSERPVAERRAPGGAVGEGEHSGEHSRREASWSEQLEAVRSGRSDTIRVAEQPVTDAMLAELRGASGLRILEVERAEVTSRGLEVLGELPALERLKLVGAAVDDEGAESIAALGQLQLLNLPDARMTDRGVERLAGLPRLALLRLGSPNVTDEGLRHIGGMQQLRFLHLIGVAMTDAGLESLYGMEQLESFYLDGVDQVSDRALAALLKALPGLHFHRDQQHLPEDPAAHKHR